MQQIKIESIKYGWFVMRFSNHYVCCSNYLGNDTPRELLNASYCLLVKKTESEWICWDDEPGAYIMNLERVEDKVLLTLYSASKNAYQLRHSSHSIKESCGEQMWFVSLEAARFTDELITEFSLYKDGIGASIYKNNWMLFPEQEFKDLEVYANELSRTLGKYEKLFCTSYGVR